MEKSAGSLECDCIQSSGKVTNASHHVHYYFFKSTCLIQTLIADAFACRCLRYYSRICIGNVCIPTWRSGSILHPMHHCILLQADKAKRALMLVIVILCNLYWSLPHYCPAWIVLKRLYGQEKLTFAVYRKWRMRSKSPPYVSTAALSCRSPLSLILLYDVKVRMSCPMQGFTTPQAA